jgi:plasmid stabilization system protein ParE
MQINKSPKYQLEFKTVLEYIAKDKVNAMLHFRRELNKSLQLLKNFPYKNRKSVYFEDENIRDMTYKGYTIIYEVLDTTIEILTIFNQNKPN